MELHFIQINPIEKISNANKNAGKDNTSSKITIKMPKIKKEILHLKCGWQTCSIDCSSGMELNDHITDHLNKFCYLKANCELICPWQDCKFKTNSLEEFQRHAYYHGYLMKLKTQGKFELECELEIPHCSLNRETLNVLPVLKENFKCCWIDCEMTYLSIVEFQDHVVKHAEFEYEMLKSPDIKTPKIRCKWLNCDRLLENKYRFLEHIGKHSNKKEVACNHCGELFKRKLYLFDHCRRQAANNTHKHQCGQCSKYFASEKLLRYHVVRHINCFKCSLCDMTCTSSSSLATHIRYRHIKDRPFKCPYCDHSCVTKYDLDKHKLVHSKVVHHCAEKSCGYAVRTYNSLRRHYIEVHSDRPYVYICHCCEKLFKHSKYLSKHLMKKHDFQLPSGHKRFTYKTDESGYYRLETMRIESLEVTKQILSPNPFETSERGQESNFEISNSYEDNQSGSISSGHITITLGKINDL